MVKGLLISYSLKTKTCYAIAKQLRQLNYSTTILTSEEKTSLTYQKLSNESLIDDSIQFLVTTNVISTGTNVLITKILVKL